MDGGSKGDDEGSSNNGHSGRGSGSNGAGGVIRGAVVIIIVPCTILSIETVPTRIVHKLVVVADAKVLEVA